MDCVATISALGAVLTLASAGDDRPLVVGSEASFPPYLVTTDGTLSGFDHEVMTEVCARISRPCTWQIATFEELIPGVIEGRFDVVLGGMAITNERLLLVDFTQPYSEGGAVDWFAGFPGAPPPEDALIAVESGTIHDSYVRAQGYAAQGYPSEDAALAAVAEGATDLSFGPYNERSDLAPLIAGRGLELLYSAEVPDLGVGMAVCKGNPLLAELDTALGAMWADGTLDTLNLRWFDS